jgi:hypothetical protein
MSAVEFKQHVQFLLKANIGIDVIGFRLLLCEVLALQSDNSLGKFNRGRIEEALRLIEQVQ